VTLSYSNKPTSYPSKTTPPLQQLRTANTRRARAVRFTAGPAFAFAGTLLAAGHALAATASTAGIGAQTQNMAQEASTTGGFVAWSAMYVAALICFVLGTWAVWQSRQEQNRSAGKLGMGLAGLALCGLFATGGIWIQKAANTTGGANGTISSTSNAVTFGQ